VAVDDIDPNKAIEYIQRESKNYADALAQANYLERYLKTKKAELMGEEVGSLGAKEAFAYAHRDYVSLLEALRTAENTKEHLRYMLDAAKLKIEVFKVLEYNKRVEIRNGM
jgi:hypothetical protein